jgi:hypothetical protein
VVRIRSGPSEVLTSGYVTAFHGHSLSFEVILNGAIFGLVLEFEADPTTTDPGVRTAVHGSTLTVTCVNFDGAEGRGSSQPVLMGEAGDDLLFLHFRVFRFGRTEDRSVHYTFYRVTKSSIHWQPA